MTPFKTFCEKWKNGCGSNQCAGAKNVVLMRGSVPARVLFVGEAPGESEDVLGFPFVGPAGILFDQIIESSVPREVHYALTNVVGCIPRDDLTGTVKAIEPDLEQIEACRPRLTEFIKLCKPELVVSVGTLAEKHAHLAVKGIKISPTQGMVTGHPTIKKWISVVHPAFIIQSPMAQQGLLRKRCAVMIEKAVEDILCPF